jgi:cell division protein FtsI/penicillin-binding protein 2
MTFGQGMDVTMLQVASGFCAAINGGYYYQPTLVAGLLQNDKLVKEAAKSSTSIISETSSHTLKDMLLKARAKYYAAGDRPGFEIGGKTGTSEVLVNGSYDKSTTIGSYLGFGGDDSPKYVIMVRVQGDGGYYDGGKTAGPIFTEISNWLTQYLNLKPKG